MRCNKGVCTTGGIEGWALELWMPMLFRLLYEHLFDQESHRSEVHVSMSNQNELVDGMGEAFTVRAFSSLKGLFSYVGGAASAAAESTWVCSWMCSLDSRGCLQLLLKKTKKGLAAASMETKLGNRQVSSVKEFLAPCVGGFCCESTPFLQAWLVTRVSEDCSSVVRGAAGAYAVFKTARGGVLGSRLQLEP